MFNVGISELLCFVVIAVLVLGPDKLPQAARFAGKSYSKFKRMMTSVQNEIDRELRLSELQNQMQLELQRIQQLEQRLNQQMHSHNGLNTATSQAIPSILSTATTSTTAQTNLQIALQMQHWTAIEPSGVAKVWHPRFKLRQYLSTPLTTLAKSA